MRSRCRKLALVVLGQAVCLAVGLFMQRQLFSSAVQRAAERQAWLTLDATAQELQHTVTAADPAQLRTAVLQLGLSGIDAMFVDRAGQPLQPDASPVPLRFTPLSERNTAEATASTGTPQTQGESARGLLEGADPPHRAVAWSLPDGETRLVVHQSNAVADAVVRTALPPLLHVDVVIFLWTSALLGMTLYLWASRHQEVLEDQRARSASHVLRQTQEIVRTRDAVIFALAKLAGSRDHETGAHLERISAYSTLIATALRSHPRYAQQVTPAFVRLIGVSSVLHDIGKVGIEDSVLRKPGRLSQAEREHMQSHTAIAGQCLGEVAQRLGGSNFLELARTIALAHHERWDGSGYPDGLKGERIPLAARIVAIADVYDALVTSRIYKGALSHEEAIVAISAAAGKQFDPDLVAVAATVEKSLCEISRRYRPTGVGDSDSRFEPEPYDVNALLEPLPIANAWAAAAENASPPPDPNAVASSATMVPPRPS